MFGIGKIIKLLDEPEPYRELYQFIIDIFNELRTRSPTPEVLIARLRQLRLVAHLIEDKCNAELKEYGA